MRSSSTKKPVTQQTLQSQVAALTKVVNELQRNMPQNINNTSINSMYQNRQDQMYAPVVQQLPLQQPILYNGNSMSVMMSFMDAINKKIDEMQKSFESFQASLIKDQTEYKAKIEEEINSLKMILKNELGIYSISCNTSSSLNSKSPVIANGLIDRVDLLKKQTDEMCKTLNTNTKKIENHKLLLKHFQAILETLPSNIDACIETQLNRLSKTHLMETMAHVESKIIESERKIQTSIEENVNQKVKTAGPYMQIDKRISAIASDIQLLAECCEQNKNKIDSGAINAADMKKRIDVLNESIQLLVGNNLFK